MAKAILFGAAGGLVGALVWAGIGIALNWEIGWLAVLVGFLVGIAMRYGKGEEIGSTLGVVAAIIAVLSVVFGKFLWVAFMVSGLSENNEELVISYIADEVVYEMESRGEQIRWPVDLGDLPPTDREEYPTKVWNEADRRWQALTEDERAMLFTCPRLANAEYVLSYIADEIAAEREEAGEVTEWPGGPEQMDYSHEADYPADIWAEAADRWDAWSTGEQDQYVAYVVGQEAKSQEAMEGVILVIAFLASFGLFDLVWGVLAIIAAYRTATGGVSG
ncbi:MAG: hypothetical protein D8M59_09070 [Planctomycetes bacterium]|nr:hypothetical protein [Planctomycetota bacterium]NOG54212.1 hypothetical protein [Planctomycetota bacterium]